MGAARGFQCVEVRTVGVSRYRDQVHVVGTQLLEQHEIARILDQHRIPGREQDARQQVEGLGGAVGGDDVGGAGGDAVLHQPRGDLLAQLAAALRRARLPGRARRLRERRVSTEEEVASSSQFSGRKPEPAATTSAGCDTHSRASARASEPASPTASTATRGGDRRRCVTKKPRPARDSSRPRATRRS